MARIETSAFKDWNDGETFKSSDYEQDREIIRTANNDNYTEIEVLKNANIGVMSRIPSGTSFPEFPTVGYTFYRTDEKREYIFDGTVWIAKPRKEQAAQQVLVLRNGWNGTGNGNTEPRYRLDDFDVVHYKGTVWGGAIADYTIIGDTPYPPSERFTVGVLNTDGAGNSKIAHLIFETDGTIKIKDVVYSSFLYLNDVSYKRGV